MEKQEIIEKRKNFLPYEEACNLQNILIDIYAKEYKPKHASEEYFRLIMDYDISAIKKRHPQENSYPDTVFECHSSIFTCVRGYTKEHCLDLIYEESEAKKERIKYYKTLPTLKELVYSDIKINSEQMYYTKENGTYEDSCDGFDGGSILKMRKMGIDKYFEQRDEGIWDMLLNMNK